MKLEHYKTIVGEEKINELYKLSEKLKDKKIVMINSTDKGGGVAEILWSLIPLFNELGIETKWLVLEGEEDFFDATKSFHNALQGELNKDIKNKISKYKNFYDNKLEELNKPIIDYLKNVNSSDIVVCHDPQPLGLIKYRKEDDSKWVWRKHIDTSNPLPELWDYIYDMAHKYNKIIVSKEDFIRGDKEKYIIIPPSIDPFTEKNKKLSEEKTKEILLKYNVPLNKPLISQISRLDKWKDPIGVIEAYRKIRKKIDCNLALVYNGATDDPEGEIMYQKVLEAKKGENEEGIYLIKGDDPLLVNVIQKHSEVVLQKSLKEGFALTVSEALFKETPVIGSNVGGIPLQIIHNKNGYLVDKYEINEKEEAINPEEKEKHIEKVSEYAIELLSNSEKRKEMGKQCKEIVKEKFLMIRHLKDYLNLFNSLYE
jgi:trehalose synthase